LLGYIPLFKVSLGASIALCIVIIQPVLDVQPCQGQALLLILDDSPHDPCVLPLCGCSQFDFGKQQQLTLKLQKLAPSEKYQWWLVDLLVLQARAAAAGAASVMGQDKLLQLAASMGARLLQAAAAAAGKEAGGSREALMLHLGVVIAQVGGAGMGLSVCEWVLGSKVDGEIWHHSQRQGVQAHMCGC
jgi:hypothetical protein